LKTLVAYYSRTGTNRSVAEKLSEELEGDLDEIIDHKKRGGAIGWLGAGTAAYRQKMTEIDTKLDPAQYDSVILCSPIWAGKITPPLRSYLATRDLKGKKLTFVFVSGGGDSSGAIEELKKILPDVDLGKTLSLSTKDVKEGGYEERVGEFAKTLGSTGPDDEQMPR
jgi:flavodoxin